MLAIITLVAPVFGLIAIGWIAARIGYVPLSAGPALSDFAYKILIPALLFRAMATMAPPVQSPWLLAATYTSAVAIVWLTATLATLLLLRRPAADAPAIAMAACFGNGLMMGIPLILSAFGPEAATPVAILVTCDFDHPVAARHAAHGAGAARDGELARSDRSARRSST